MERDIELDRKTARNWKEYLKEIRNEKDMFVWVWQELINSKGKTLAKKMFWATLISYILAVIKPWTLALIFNGLAARPLQENLVIIGLALCGMTIILAQLVNRKGLLYRELLFGENMRQLDKRITELFFEKSLGTHIDENNLLNEANIKKGHERVFQLSAMMVWQGVESILGLTLPFCALWFLDWKVAIGVTIMLITHLIWSLFLNQRAMKAGVPIDKKWRDLNRFRVERLYQIERVKTSRKEEDELAELGRKFEDAIIPDRKLWTWFIEQVTRRGFVDYLLLIGAMIYGTYMVWNGEMAIGLLYPLFTWTSQLADNLWRVGHLEHQINFLTPSILAMKEALTMPIGLVLPQKPKQLSKDASCRVEFQNVSYIYPRQKSLKGKRGNPVPVLDNISFSVNSGEKVALIGSSGVGKTTIMRLLLRYMDPTSGSIKADGIDLRELELGSWLRLVGYVPQQAQILDGTIRYNLLYGLPDCEKQQVSDEELWNVMRSLQIDFGERLTHGLDTLVGRNGIKLSGGQAQRVMVGAAVMKNPRFMIIDEATSSLDPTTERLVQEGLEKVLTGDRGALIITHRLNTVRRICNRFVVLSGNGESRGSKVIAIADSFEDLAATSSEFCSLALDQGIIV